MLFEKEIWQNNLQKQSDTANRKKVIQYHKLQEKKLYGTTICNKDMIPQVKLTENTVNKVNTVNTVFYIGQVHKG